MTAKREICITEDPYAYDESEVNDYTILAGYSTANDYITYQKAGHANTATFRTLRMTSHEDGVERDTVREEATDQAAIASLFGGTISPTGNFAGAYRGWDFHLSGLLKGIMGYQTPATVANPATGFSAGYRYELTTTPSTLAVKIVDESAKNTDGSKGATRVYRGVGISSFELRFPAKQYATATCQWMARRPEVYDVAYNSNTEPAGDPALFYNPVLKWTPEGGSASAFKCQEFTMTVSRPIDTDNYSLGTEFLIDLTYNGLSELSGSFTLSPNDWDKMRATLAGSNDSTVKVLDQGKKEYFGEVTNSTTSTVLANAIPSGSLEITLHTPNGSQVIGRITCQQAKLTGTRGTVQGAQRWNKTVNWMAVTNNTYKFYIDVWQPV